MSKPDHDMAREFCRVTPAHPDANGGAQYVNLIHCYLDALAQLKEAELDAGGWMVKAGELDARAERAEAHVRRLQEGLRELYNLSHELSCLPGAAKVDVRDILTRATALLPARKEADA